MLISYEPVSDILTISVQSAPVAQSQMQGTVSVGFDAVGGVVSVSIPEASSVLWERGGQVQIALPQATQTIVTQQVVPAQTVPQQVVSTQVAPAQVVPAQSVTETVVTRVVD